MNKQTSVVTEDKSLQSFILLSVIMTALLLLILFSFITVKYSLFKDITNIIKLSLVGLTLLTASFLFLISIVLIHIYKANHATPVNLWIARLGLYLILPITIALSEFLNYHRDEIRLFYISINNIIIRSSIGLVERNKILILLPHCLQNSDCIYRITSDISNCRMCFKCTIGYIKEYTDGEKLPFVSVASGGSAARSIVNRVKPDLIIAVACERDLVSGIADVKGIPTIGILNKRPNGPCINTDIDVEEFRSNIEDVLK